MDTSNTDRDPVLRSSISDLVSFVPGTNPRWWLTTGIPLIVAAGAVRRVGRRWIGRRSAIETALTTAPTAPTVPTVPTASRRGPR